MDQKIVITIARQFGSGGRSIGEKLAKELGIPFYDKSLIHLAAKDSGLDESLFEHADEMPSNSFWNTTVNNTSIFGNRLAIFHDMPMNDRLFVFQSNIIKKIASEGSCVIVGRCADDILREEKNAVHVFIHASEEHKLDRIIHTYGIPEEKAREIMVKTDKKRAAYYNYYTGGKWGMAENYDLSLNSGVIGIDDAVELIIEFTKRRKEK